MKGQAESEMEKVLRGKYFKRGAKEGGERMEEEGKKEG